MDFTDRQQDIALANEADGEAEFLAEEIKRLRALAAPIRQLPTEILSQILGYVCSRVQFGLTTRSYPAVIASQVCHQWRTILLETPSMWSVPIHIELAAFPMAWRYGSSAQTHPGMRRRVWEMRQALAHYVSRSDYAPLVLRISHLSCASAYKARDVICASIGKHSGLWSSVNLPVCIASVLPKFLDVSGAGAPMLERLHCEWCPENCYEQARPLPLHNSPRLRQLIVPKLQLVSCPLQQMTDIHINSWIEYDACVLDLVWESRLSLQSLQISLDERGGELALQTALVVPKLTRLDITTDDFKIISEFCRYITTPALTHLILRGGFRNLPSLQGQENCILSFARGEANRLDAIHTFLQRSQCHINRLELRSVSLSPPDLHRLLREMPFLQHLRIFDNVIQRAWNAAHHAEADFYRGPEPYSSLTSDLFLAMAGSSQPLLPRLQSLHFKGPLYSVFEGELRDAIDCLRQSRTAPPSVSLEAAR
ncbi:hypothetical protein HDZ31DRAFT_30966 [Schizophyllum fasciatum]